MSTFVPSAAARCAALALLGFALSACRGRDDAAAPSTATATTPAAGAARADSQYAPAAMIARFRQQQAPARVTAFGSDASTSRDALVARYVHALEHADTAAFRAMRLSLGEFAWTYYADAPLAKPPYELDPDVMWMQISAQSDRGLTRALQRFGGRPFGLTTTRCEAPTTSGALRFHTCTITGTITGRAVALPLSIVERDGRFKFVGYANQL